MTPRRALSAALPAAAPRGVETGALFAGHHLIEELGRGGMGLVFSACHAASDRLVALKIPPAGACAELLARFRAEAQAMGALDHPGIVPVYEVGEFDGVPFFTMRLAEGGNLAARFRTAPRDAAAMLARVADAIQHAHERGLLHRDIKPANILLTTPDEPLVADFGLARWLRGDGDLTVSGALLGTPGYLAPELLGKAEATIASDVFSLGAVLYFLLAGRAPFEGASVAETLTLVAGAETTPLPAEVPRDLAAICAKCLEREPARRYATAADFATDLRHFLAGEPTAARPASPVEKAWRWCRRRPALAALLALLAVVTVVAFVMIDAARRAEIAVRSRLAESLDRTELDRAEDLFRAGDSAGALAPLVRVLHRNPAHPVAGPRLASALWHGDFALPLPPPLTVGAPVVQMQLLRDGHTLLVCSTKGAATWDAVTGRRLLEFEHDGSRIFSAALSPDERTLVAWDAEPGKTMTIFDTATGRRRVPSLTHNGFLHTVAFSPDSTRIVTAGSEPFARIRDARTGDVLGESLEQPPGLWSAAFSPDGETIATSAETTVRLWDAHAQQLRFESEPLDRDVKTLLFSPDGRWLVATSFNGTARILSTADAEIVGLPMRHEGKIRAANFSADGQRLLTASHDHTARVWSVPGGEPLAPVLRHSDAVNFAAFSPDGARIVTASLDNSARVWDANTGRPLSQPLRHFEQVSLAAFTPDGAMLCTGGADGGVQRWSLRAGAETGATFPGTRAEFSADGSRVIAAAQGEFVRDTAGLRAVAEFSGEMRLAHLSADGRRAAVVTESGTVSIVPLDAARAKTITIPNAGRIADICFSSDGMKLAIASEDRTARVWDAATGRAITPPLTHGAPVRSVRFSPDGRMLLTATWTPQTAATGLDEARLWDAATGQPIGRPMKHDDDVLSAEFSPDGALVATASDDNTACVWDARTGAPVSHTLRHARSVVAVAFSPDSRRVATASWDGTARIWDAHTGTPLARALTHEDHVTDVRFSADGRRLATASRDNTARVWDAASGQPLTEPLRHAAPVEQVRFHPDGQRLLTSTADTVRIWDAPDFSTTPPAWLPQLAEVISLSELPPDPAAALALIVQYERTCAAALAEPGDGAYAHLARRLFAPGAAEPLTQGEGR